jgi:hypothetical protein
LRGGESFAPPDPVVDAVHDEGAYGD